jgi:hypothetical protein
VTLLRRLNPGVPICGVFGGERGYKANAFRVGGKTVLGLDDFYWSRQEAHWNWKNGDLVLASWYRDVGCRLEFDVVHVVEWDLLLVDSLERLYASVPREAVGLTAFTPLSLVGPGWHWLQRPEDRRQWEELLTLARSAWSYDSVPHACVFPGCCFPRSFLAQYAALDPPDLCHDELRLPLLVQILGFPVAETGFRRQSEAPGDRFFTDREEDRLFNTIGREIDPATILAELRKSDGRRAFHPVRAPLRELSRMIGEPADVPSSTQH